MTEINEEYKIGDYVLFSRKINDVFQILGVFNLSY